MRMYGRKNYFFFQAKDGIRDSVASRGLGMCIRDRKKYFFSEKYFFTKKWRFCEFSVSEPQNT